MYYRLILPLTSCFWKGPSSSSGCIGDSIVSIWFNEVIYIIYLCIYWLVSSVIHVAGYFALRKPGGITINQSYQAVSCDPEHLFISPSWLASFKQPLVSQVMWDEPSQCYFFHNQALQPLLFGKDVLIWGAETVDGMFRCPSL